MLLIITFQKIKQRFFFRLCIILYSIFFLSYHIVLHQIILFCIVSYCIISSCIISYFIILYCIRLCHILKFYAHDNLFLISICKFLLLLYINIIKHDRTSSPRTYVHWAEIRIFHVKKYFSIFLLISINDNLHQFSTSNLCKMGN